MVAYTIVSHCKNITPLPTLLYAQ